MRLLKRYLARELFPLLKADLHHALNSTRHRNFCPSGAPGDLA
jgi:hypothetical protein